MLKSTNSLIGALLLLVALIVLVLYVFQRGGLLTIQYMLSRAQSTGLPAGSTPVSGFSFPTAQAPAGYNTELTVGDLAITVTGIVSPADHLVGTANRFNVLEKDEEYLVVYIKTRCISTSETCRVIESDFGIESSTGRDYPAEFSTSFSEIKGLFEGGDIPPGQNLGGSLIFIIKKGDKGMTLVYPRMFGFGNTVKFTLGK